MYADDVSLAEDLSLGGLGFLALLLVPIAVFALIGTTVGGLVASALHRDRARGRHRR
jgi:hypothetical protein